MLEKHEDCTFSVLTFSKTKPNNDCFNYCHWSEGLTMVIVKNGVTICLDSSEVQQVVKALPRTIGGLY